MNIVNFINFQVIEGFHLGQFKIGIRGGQVQVWKMSMKYIYESLIIKVILGKKLLLLMYFNLWKALFSLAKFKHYNSRIGRNGMTYVKVFLNMHIFQNIR